MWFASHFRYDPHDCVGFGWKMVEFYAKTNICAEAIYYKNQAESGKW